MTQKNTGPMTANLARFTIEREARDLAERMRRERYAIKKAELLSAKLRGEVDAAEARFGRIAPDPWEADPAPADWAPILAASDATDMAREALNRCLATLERRKGNLRSLHARADRHETMLYLTMTYENGDQLA